MASANTFIVLDLTSMRAEGMFNTCGEAEAYGRREFPPHLRWVALEVRPHKETSYRYEDLP